MREGDRTGLVLCPDRAIMRELIQEIGVFGQAFFPRRHDLSLGGVVGFACLLLLVTCAVGPGERLQSSRALPLGRPDGRWIGSVTPIDPDCGLRTTGLMSIGTDTFAFDPFQSTAVVRGRIGPAGNLAGETVRPAPGNKSITMGFLGRIQYSEGFGSIVGTLTSGRCHWSVTLLRG